MANFDETLGQSIVNEIESHEDEISKHGGMNINFEDIMNGKKISPQYDDRVSSRMQDDIDNRVSFRELDSTTLFSEEFTLYGTTVVYLDDAISDIALLNSLNEDTIIEQKESLEVLEEEIRAFHLEQNPPAPRDPSIPNVDVSDIDLNGKMNSIEALNEQIPIVEEVVEEDNNSLEDILPTPIAPIIPATLESKEESNTQVETEKTEGTFTHLDTKVDELTHDVANESDTGVSDTDDITNDKTPVIEGYTEANASVVISDESGDIVGEGVADEEGYYAITTSELKEGNQDLTITVTDSAGNSASGIQNITIDSSTFSEVELVDENLDEVISSEEVSSSDINGKVEPGSHIDSVIVTDGLNNITIDKENIIQKEDGTFFVKDVDVSSLMDDELTVIVTSTDKAGNIITSNNSINKDTSVVDAVDDSFEKEVVEASESKVLNQDDIYFAKTDAKGQTIASMGTVIGEDGKEYSVWRLRNGSDEDIKVKFQSLEEDFSKTLTLLNNTDTYILSPVVSGDAMHKVSFDGNTKTKSINKVEFNEDIELSVLDSNLITDENMELVITPKMLFENDVVSGDVVIKDVIALENTNGEIKVNEDGNILYNPDENYNGNASFAYTVENENGKLDTAIVTLHVNSIDNEFKANDENVTLNLDSPVSKLSSVAVSDGETQSTNIILTIDTSGSMTNKNYGGVVKLPDGSRTTRLDLAKESLENIINEFSSIGEVNVNLTTFSSYGHSYGWMGASDALRVINTLRSGGATNYEDAIADTIVSAKEAPSADKTVALFVSDGEPTSENDDRDKSNMFDDEYVESWSNFVEQNVDQLIVVGMGTGIKDTSYLEKVAVEVGDVQVNMLVIENELELNEVLMNTITESTKSIEGNILDNIDNSDSEIGIDYVVIDGVEYTSDNFPVGGIITNNGANFDLNFTSGEYLYTASTASFKESMVEKFGVKVTNESGNSAVFNMNFSVNIDEMASLANLDMNISDVNVVRAPKETIYEYEMDVAATLSDNDGSEILSDITLLNIPETVKILNINGEEIERNDDGSYTLDSSNTDITLQSKVELSDEALDGIVATVTSTELESGDTSTVAINQDGSLDAVGEVEDDSFEFDENGFDLNFTDLDTSDKEDINILDMSRGEHFISNIGIDDVMDMTDENNTLKVLGGSDDKISLDTTAWKKSSISTDENGDEFIVYTGSGMNNEEIQLLVNTSVTVHEV
jgi:hypothetical protein